MRFKVRREEWKKLTYVWRIVLLFLDVILGVIVFSCIKDNEIGIGIGNAIVFFLPSFYMTYVCYRTPYFSIPMSRYYNAQVLKKSVENEEFKVLKEKTIWESEHWLRIKNEFFPRSMICRLGGSVASGSIMTVTTIDKKVYTLHHMGHLERSKEEKIIGDTLPLVELLNGRGYDGQSALERQPCVSEEYLSEMMTKYLENHSVEDMVLRTDIMEMYVNEYDKIKSGGRRKKEMAV